MSPFLIRVFGYKYIKVLISLQKAFLAFSLTLSIYSNTDIHDIL